MTRTLRRAASLLHGAFEDVATALLPGACRQCGATLPAAPTAPRAARPYSALYDGRMRRALLGPLTLPLWLLCPTCAATLRPASAGGRLAGRDVPCVTAFEPAPALFELVHALKYDGFTELAPWMGAFLARAARRSLGPDLVLLPLPLHPTRRRERGFDQSALLARAAAARLSCPLVETLLLRCRATAPQARLPSSRRAANVHGAFARRGEAPAGTSRLVLVDDVVTTGATAAAALAALGCDPSRAAVLALCAAGQALAPAVSAPAAPIGPASA